jgi:hypothetical protein
MSPRGGKVRRPSISTDQQVLLNQQCTLFTILIDFSNFMARVSLSLSLWSCVQRETQELKIHDQSVVTTAQMFRPPMATQTLPSLKWGSFVKPQTKQNLHAEAQTCTLRAVITWKQLPTTSGAVRL